MLEWTGGSTRRLKEERAWPHWAETGNALIERSRACFKLDHSPPTPDPGSPHQAPPQNSVSDNGRGPLVSMREPIRCRHSALSLSPLSFLHPPLTTTARTRESKRQTVENSVCCPSRGKQKTACPPPTAKATFQPLVDTRLPRPSAAQLRSCKVKLPPTPRHTEARAQISGPPCCRPRAPRPLRPRPAPPPPRTLTRATTHARRFTSSRRSLNSSSPTSPSPTCSASSRRA